MGRGGAARLSTPITFYSQVTLPGAGASLQTVPAVAAHGGAGRREADQPW